MNILVTGADGQLGRCIQDCVNEIGNGKPDHFVGEPNYYIFTGRKDLDVTDEVAVRTYVREHKICVIVNCAAYTNVNGAQVHRKDAYDVNAIGALNLAFAASDVGAVLIQISTDYVHRDMYDKPIPPNVLVVENTVEPDDNYYGYTKAIGEELISDVGGCKYIILRTSWLCSEYGKNFVKTMVDRAEKAEPSEVVFDQVGCFTDALELARLIVKIIEENSSQTPYLSKHGIYNACGAGPTTWYSIAKNVYRYALSNVDIVKPKNTPKDDVVKRPRYSVLDTKKTEEAFGYVPKMWDDAIIGILKRMGKYLHFNITI